MKQAVIFNNGEAVNVIKPKFTIVENMGVLTCTIVCEISQPSQQLLETEIPTEELESGEIEMSIGSDIATLAAAGRITANDFSTIFMNVSVNVKGKKKDLTN